jgi:hypothetical protein
MLYPTISNRLGLNDDIVEIFAKIFGTDFMTLVFLKMRGTQYQF